jgi:ATP synthase protein I
MTEDPSLNSLKKRIYIAKQTKEEPEPLISEQSVNNMNKGMQILTEMIGIMVASGAIGYFLDLWLGSSPAMILIFLTLGMITFFYKLIKATKKSVKL